MKKLFEEAKIKEKEYHDNLYSTTALFSPGTWLYRPNQYVTDSFKCLIGKKNIRALDLGCGVGRHNIVLAKFMKKNNISGKIVCIDLLESAITKLKENSIEHKVEDTTEPIKADVENYQIRNNYYGYILSASCIEHVSSKAAYEKTVSKIIKGTKKEGINCFLINTDIVWKYIQTDKIDDLAVELNLSTEEGKNILTESYQRWDIVDLSIKKWQTKETISIFESQCLQFLAIKK